tara:strand:+ start:24074 stop:24355 length:282 start_codon:yes stop_codon:yes gene_type:complete
MATNDIKLTGKEYTITFTENMYDYIVEHSLLETIKTELYTNFDGIDAVLEYHGSLIIDVNNINLNPATIYAKVVKVIGNHKLSQRTKTALIIH